MGSCECVAITMITYPDTSTHRWSLARIDISFDWTRMPSRNDIAIHLLLVDPPHRTFAKVGAAVYHDGRDIIVARTSRCARALPSVPFPTAALIPSLSGAAHRRTVLPQARSLSGSRLSLGLPKRFQSFLRLHAHPDPLLRPVPLRCAMDIYSHIYPSLDPVLTAPLRHTPPPRSARAGLPRHSSSTQRTAARGPRRPSPSGVTSPARAPPRNPSPSHPSPVLHRTIGSVTVLPTTSPGESSRWQFCAGDIDTGRHRAFHLPATDSIDRCKLP
ncbi:hypothetical protein B0H14DRAFT_528092 [Mycena olivaceomarginata]|nr:hypothetical protein B0H14DRAFT_528092 [Mycena olivaceomarginata]